MINRPHPVAVCGRARAGDLAAGGFAKAITVTDPNGEIVVRGSGEHGTLTIGKA